MSFCLSKQILLFKPCCLAVMKLTLFLNFLEMNASTLVWKASSFLSLMSFRRISPHMRICGGCMRSSMEIWRQWAKKIGSHSGLCVCLFFIYIELPIICWFNSVVHSTINDFTCALSVWHTWTHRFFSAPKVYVHCCNYVFRW